ncbi:MAG: hypothetical protein PHH37_01385 [Paludibacter sp.]|nr:hypothetical protein [Paludibacter sp.]
MNLSKTHSILTIIFFSLTLNSCITSHKFNQIINEKVDYEFHKKSNFHSDKISIDFQKFPHDSVAVVTKRRASFFIPAIVVWGWNKKYDCHISNDYFNNIINNSVSEISEDLLLEKHLGDRKLKITIDELPNNLTYQNFGLIMYFVVTYNYVYNESIKQNNQKLKISYQITDNENVIKTDSVSYDFNAKIRNNGSESTEFIINYMNEFKQDFQDKSHQFIEKIIEDL